MKAETWKALDQFFLESPILRAEAVDPSEIAAAEAEVGITLSRDYKDFIARYGAAIVGPFRIFGLRRAAAMGKNEGSFVEVTKTFRRNHCPGTDQWAVISTDHAGNPVGLDAGEKVWISDHQARAVQIIANDFEDCLWEYCLNFLG